MSILSKPLLEPPNVQAQVFTKCIKRGGSMFSFLQMAAENLQNSELLAPFRSDHDDLGDLPPCLQLHNDLAEV
jgi:hypothetical protein